MFRRTALIVLASLAAAQMAGAQSLSEYLKMRKAYGIKRAAGVEALDSFVGSRVVEIQGVVKGSFKFHNKYTVLVERDGGSTMDIESGDDLDWLTGGEIHARLLVQASRKSDSSELKMKLLGAAPEQDIAAIDLKEERRSAVSKTPARHSSSRTFREWNLPESQASAVYANFIRRQNKRLSPDEALLIAKGIIGFSLKYGVDARLIMAMVMVESGFDPNSTSRTGAAGLGQLMPGTAKWMGVTNSYDTVENLYGTVKLVRNHLDKYNKQTGDSFQSLVLALAAYNAGEGAVSRAGGVPPYAETQAYVRRVINLYAQFSGRR